MDPITIASAAIGVSQGIMGAIQGMKAGAERKRNVRPVMEIPKEIRDNVQTYAQQAQSGISEDYLSRMNQKSLQGLTAMLQNGAVNGADPNTLSDYYSAYLQNMGGLYLQSADRQMQAIDRLAQARSQLADYKMIEFGYNKDAPYKDKAQALTVQAQQGVQNLFGGASTAVNQLANMQSRGLYNDYLKAATKSLSAKNAAAPFNPLSALTIDDTPPNR